MVRIALKIMLVKKKPLSLLISYCLHFTQILSTANSYTIHHPLIYAFLDLPVCQFSGHLSLFGLNFLRMVQILVCKIIVCLVPSKKKQKNLVTSIVGMEKLNYDSLVSLSAQPREEVVGEHQSLHYVMCVTLTILHLQISACGHPYQYKAQNIAISSEDSRA